MVVPTYVLARETGTVSYLGQINQIQAVDDSAPAARHHVHSIHIDSWISATMQQSVVRDRRFQRPIENLQMPDGVSVDEPGLGRRS